MSDVEKKPEAPKTNGVLRINISKTTITSFLALAGALGAFINGESNAWNSATQQAGNEIQVEDSYQRTRGAITQLIKVVKVQRRQIDEMQGSIEQMGAALKALGQHHPRTWQKFSGNVELDKLEEALAKVEDELGLIEEDLPESVRFPALDRIRSFMQEGNSEDP